jgi:hypothetical protein
MKHVFSISCAAFLSLVLLATSCQKGDTGPEGPQGPAGPAGPQGPKGDTGVANVIYSTWLDVLYEPITDSVTGDTVLFVGEIPAPKLTASIINSGDIKVYFNWRTSANPDISPLPYVEPLSGLYINPEFIVGSIFLISDANPSTRGTGANKQFQHRYVLIPGGVPARSAIDWNNYENVKKYLNLPD